MISDFEKPTDDARSLSILPDREAGMLPSRQHSEMNLNQTVDISTVQKKTRPEGNPIDDVLRALEAIREEMNQVLHRLDAIEDRIGETMTKDDLRALDTALQEHARGESISLEDARRLL